MIIGSSTREIILPTLSLKRIKVINIIV
jgi:hypothetical protein